MAEHVTPDLEPRRPSVVETARPGARPGRPRKGASVSGEKPAPPTTFPPSSTPAAPDLPPAEFTAETIEYFLRMMGGVLAVLVALFFRVPMRDAVGMWAFNAAELKALTPPTRTVINLRAPEWMKIYQAEISLALCFLPIFIGKVALLVSYREEQAKARELPEPEKREAAPAAKPNGSGAGEAAA